MSQRVLYTIQQAMEQLAGLSEDYVRQAIRSTGGPGQIPPLRAKKAKEGGRTYLIRHVDLEAWAESLPDA